jgi:hypothetical protein
MGGRKREALSPRATAEPSTCETHLCGGEPRGKPDNRRESDSFVEVCVVRPAAKQDQDILLR